MKLIILIFSIFLQLLVLKAHAFEICSSKTKQKDEYVFNRVQCIDLNDCWLQFKIPEDQLEIRINEDVISLYKNGTYLSNEVMFIPLQTASVDNKIVISVRDVNQDIKTPNELCINVGRFNELRFLNSMTWFFKTGINLFSVYSLVLVSIFLAISLVFKKNQMGVSLLVYSSISCLYLLSFSEYPRSFLDPVLLTGGIHFPLRLMQDLSLIFVFYIFYNKYDSYKLIKKISYVYLIVIGIYFLLLLIGIRDYVYYSRIIVLMAPLVALPMAIGTWFAFKLEDKFEKKILIPVSVALLVLQINDLFVFWKFIDGYFTVKFYIPLIVGLTLLMYLKRLHDDVLKFESNNEKQKIMKEFIHDVKSPIAVLRIFNNENEANVERQKIVNSALDRIEGMMLKLETSRISNIKKVDVVSSIRLIISQKKVEYPDADIEFYPPVEKIYTLICDNSFQRIMSNLINNAYQSYSKRSVKKINIDLIVGDDELRILTSDSGCGIPKNIRNKIFQSGTTTKKTGTGLGLSSAFEYLSAIGGNIKVISKENVGTTVEIQINTVLGDIKPLNDSNESMSKELVNYDYILIDDDKYIRMSWEYFGTNSLKKIRTFPDVQSFFKDLDNLNRDCTVYLDLNINGEKTTKYIDEIYKLGFTKIMLATGEEIEPGMMPQLVQSVSGKLPPLH